MKNPPIKSEAPAAGGLAGVPWRQQVFKDYALFTTATQFIDESWLGRYAKHRGYDPYEFARHYAQQSYKHIQALAVRSATQIFVMADKKIEGVEILTVLLADA